MKSFITSSILSISLVILGLLLTFQLTSAASLPEATKARLQARIHTELIKAHIQQSSSSYLSPVSRAVKETGKCGIVDFGPLIPSLTSCSGCFSDGATLSDGTKLPDVGQLGLPSINLPENDECSEECCVSFKLLSSTSVETVLCGTNRCCHRIVVHSEAGFESIAEGNATDTSGIITVIDFNVFSFEGKDNDGQCKLSNSPAATCRPRCAVSSPECDEDELMIPAIGKPLVKDPCTGDAIPGADADTKETDKEDDSESTTSSSDEPSANTGSADNDDDDDDDDDPVCFPANANVRLADDSTLQISNLNIGDVVQCGNGQTSPVIAFSHRKTEGIYSFIELTTQDGFTVRATKGHLMNAGGSMKQMREVNIGDQVTTMKGVTHVGEIRNVVSKGLFNPHTECGQIEVDGVVMSTYTSAVDEITAHAVLLPVRASVKWMPVARVMGSVVEGASDLGRYLIRQGKGVVTSV